MSGLKQCCATGSLHTGTPTGEIKKIHGLDTYVAEAPTGSPKGLIVLIPDAFGIGLPNNRILADAYAKRTNSLVYLPDFMNGNLPQPPSPNSRSHIPNNKVTGYVLPADALISYKAMSATGLWNQLYKLGHFLYLLRYFVPFLIYARPAVAAPKVFKFFKDLRSENGEAKDLPVGTAGFCWGGNFVTQLCWDQEKAANGKRLVDCGFVAHPSMLKYPGDIEMILLPYSCAASEHDEQMSPEDAKKTKQILMAKTAKTKDQGVEHEFVMYGGAHHGFAVRADEHEKTEAEAGQKAEDQAVSWFLRWFANPPP
jgi:dienelactone hydrolase